MPYPRQPEPPVSPRGGVRSRVASSESGFLLLFVIFLAALMLIALAVAAPRIATSIQRDKEIELVHRGEQYKRAIKLYYRKFGTYPNSIDQLLDTNNIRFLRKKYTDPITGKDDWRIIHLGQAKVPPLGFFGQPLTGLTGPSNVGTPIANSGGATAGSTPGTLPGNPFGGDTGTAPFSAPDTSNSAAGNPTTTEAPQDSGSANSFGSSGTSSSPFGSSNSGSSGSGSSLFGSSSGPGSSFGGGPIVGVGIPSTKASLLDYKKQDHYNKWEFVYNPIEDQMNAANAALAGGGVQSSNGSDGGATSGFGSSNSGFGSSGSNGLGNSNSGFGSSNNNSGFGSSGNSGFGSSGNSGFGSSSNSGFGSSSDNSFGGATTSQPSSNQPQQ